MLWSRHPGSSNLLYRLSMHFEYSLSSWTVRVSGTLTDTLLNRAGHDRGITSIRQTLPMIKAATSSTACGRQLPESLTGFTLSFRKLVVLFGSLNCSYVTSTPALGTTSLDQSSSRPGARHHNQHVLRQNSLPTIIATPLECESSGRKVLRFLLDFHTRNGYN